MCEVESYWGQSLTGDRLSRGYFMHRANHIETRHVEACDCRRLVQDSIKPVIILHYLNPGDVVGSRVLA